jgi:hypothetical protein
MAPFFQQTPQQSRLLSDKRFGENLLLQATDSSPTTGWGALARALTGGIGGYTSAQADKKLEAKDAEAQQTLARALTAGQGWNNPDNPSEQLVKPDMKEMARILTSNPQTAQMGYQQMIADAQYGRERGDKLADTKSAQDFTLGRDKLQNEFASAQGELQRAHADASQDKSLAAQERLAMAQQRFTAAENALNRGVTQSEGAANRGTQLGIAQTQAARAGVPAGYQPDGQGGIKPMAGSPQATEAADLAKSKTEAVVSTDRMIRSIDELSQHPGLGKAVGTLSGPLMKQIPGSDAASFDVRLDTLKSQAFLPMVAQLKGMGQLSDAEGKKLTAAIGALDTRMSADEFRRSLAEIKSDLTDARKRMGAPEASTVKTPPATGGIKFLGFE